jgi:hypothetical protein
MPPKQQTQAQGSAPLNKDELVGLTTSLQGLTTRLRATGRLDYETPAGREVALHSLLRS